jgi:hypothetical protein
MGAYPFSGHNVSVGLATQRVILSVPTQKRGKKRGFQVFFVPLCLFPFVPFCLLDLYLYARFILKKRASYSSINPSSAKLK